MTRREALKRTAILSGAALSSSLISGILQGCQASKELDWIPAFFTQKEINVLEEMAETILPRTDTPGARYVLVHRFIDSLVGDCFTSEEQISFRDGLAVLSQKCLDQNGGRSFEKLTVQERLDFLNAENAWALAELEKPQAERQYPDQPPFFISLKQLVISGYFSSEEVGEKILAYDPVPGDYVGCIDLSEVGKACSP